MARLQTRIPSYNPGKSLELNWDGFRRGVNTLLKETEVGKDELVQADNLMLIGKGVPTKRWGTALYFLAGATGSVRGIRGFYQSDGTNQLLAITDQGVLTKQSGASYSIITGASWASGYNANMEQLGDKMYIVNGQREIVRYSNPTLTSFPTISTPTGLFATGLSGVSGTNTLGYRVSAIGKVGETLAASSYALSNQPATPEEGSVKVTWTAVSAASGDLLGYNVYGRNLGDERFLGSVDQFTTTYIDNGSAIPSEFTYPPTADSTGGVKAKYIKRFQDRLVYAGISGEPSKVVISGRWPNQEKNDVSYGGNICIIEPDAGDNITGLEVFEQRIIVFKERSIWQITLSGSQAGNFFIWTPELQLITRSHGAIAPRSIMAVENDIFFLTRKGVYALGYEPNVLVVLRTNEISAKIRPFFESLTPTQLMGATAFYHEFKYGISFPGKDKTVVYDRERLAWMGPWDRDGNVYETYYDSSNNEHLLSGSDTDAQVVEYDSSFGDDLGTAIATILRTKKDDFGDWTKFKNLRTVQTEFRNVSGTVNVDIRLQTRDGQVTTTKSFNISPASSNAGWASFLWGDAKWGDTPESGAASDTNEIYRRAELGGKTTRTMQVIISTSNRNDNYELLSIRATANVMGKGILPASERV